MARMEMTMPKMGESIMEGTVLKWLKQVGDAIEQDESVLEVATDKVDTEVPALHAGTLQEILVQEGDVVAVGAPIAVIETEVAGAAVPTPAAPATADNAATDASASNDAKEAAATVPHVPQAAPSAPAAAPLAGRFYSPLVLSIAREEGIGLADLEQLPGTGAEGRVTKKDILDYVADGKKPLAPPLAEAPTAPTLRLTPTPVDPPTSPTSPPPAPASSNGQPPKAAAPQPAAPSAKPAPSISGGDELVEMDRMRKLIAQRMVDSQAHFAPRHQLRGGRCDRAGTLAHPAQGCLQEARRAKT